MKLSASAASSGAAAAVTVISVILSLPFLHYVEWLGDEGIWLDGAIRMLHGDRLYTDFFEFFPPGGFLLVVSWFHLFGSSFLAARLLALLTTAGIACFTYLACVEASRSIVLSAIAAILWVMWSQMQWSLQLNHHSFTTLLSMIAGWAALRSQTATKRDRILTGPILAGMAAGAACMVTPTCGALAALACLYAFAGSGSQTRLTRCATILRYAAACTVVPILLGIYIFAHGALSAAFSDIVLFSAGHYSAIQTVPFGHGPLRSPLKFIPPLTAIMLALLCIVDWQQAWRGRILWISTALALAGLLGTYPRPDLVHIAFTLPLILPLTTICASRLAFVVRSLQTHRLVINLVMVAALLWCLPGIIWFYRDAKQALDTPLTLTARGAAAFREAGAADLVKKLSTETGNYFFYPYMPMLPYLTGKSQVSAFDVFLPNYTTAHQFEEACRAVAAQASNVVLNTDWIDSKFLHLTFPALLEDDMYQKRFNQTLKANFKVQWHSGNFEILRRSANFTANVCGTRFQ